MQKLKKTSRKHKKDKNKKEKINIKTRKIEKLEEKHKKKKKKNRNTVFPAHEPPRKTNISKGLAGRFMFFILFVVLFLLSF